MSERPHGLGMSLDDLFSENQPVSAKKEAGRTEPTVIRTDVSETAANVPQTSEEAAEPLSASSSAPQAPAKDEEIPEKSQEKSALSDVLADATEEEATPSAEPKTYSHIVVRGYVETEGTNGR